MSDSFLIKAFCVLYLAILGFVVWIAMPSKRRREEAKVGIASVWGTLKFSTLAAVFVIAGVFCFCVGLATLPVALFAVGMAKIGGR